MQKIPELMQNGQVNEAEAVLDRALVMLGLSKAEQAGDTPNPFGGGLPPKLAPSQEQFPCPARTRPARQRRPGCWHRPAGAHVGDHQRLKSSEAAEGGVQPAAGHVAQARQYETLQDGRCRS